MPYKDPEKRRENQRKRNKVFWEKHRTANIQKMWEGRQDPDVKLQHRIYAVTKLYNLTADTYIKMLVEQDNKCAICNKEETIINKRGDVRPLCVDHCHATGAVRGLLCNHCNSMLGHARDCIETVEAGLAYLKRHKE